MQPLSLHAGGPRSREGGEAEAVSPSWPRRQGVEVKEKRMAGKPEFDFLRNVMK